MEGFFEEDVCFVEKDICDGMEPMVEEKEEQRTGASSEDKIDYPLVENPGDPSSIRDEEPSSWEEPIII